MEEEKIREMEDLKHFIDSNLIDWNWCAGEPNILFMWIPYELMDQFTTFPRVERVLDDVGTVEAQFSIDTVCINVCEFYDSNDLQRYYPNDSAEIQKKEPRQLAASYRVTEPVRLTVFVTKEELGRLAGRMVSELLGKEHHLGCGDYIHNGRHKVAFSLGMLSKDDLKWLSSMLLAPTDIESADVLSERIIENLIPFPVWDSFADGDGMWFISGPQL